MADQPQDFQTWLQSARDKARTGGIAPEDADRAIANWLVSKGGWSQDQVVKAMSPPSPPPPPPERQGYLGQLKQAWEYATSGQDPKALMRFPFEAMMGGPTREGGLYDLLQGARNVGQDIGQGQYQKAAGDVVAGAGPAVVGGLEGGPLGAIFGAFAGPQMQQGAQQLAQGNILSGLGNVGGAAFETEPGAIIKGAMSFTDPLAANLYKRAMRFPRSMSRQEMAAATQLGLTGRGLGGVSKAIDTLGHVDDPDSFLGDLEKQAQDALNSKIQASGTPQKIHWNTVRQPLADEYQRSLADKTTKGLAYSKGLKEELDNFDRQHPGGDVDVLQAQAEKRAIYRNLSPSVFSDAVQAPTPAQAEGSRLLARGLKDAINDVAPEMAGINDKMHNAILLQNRLIDIEKTHPGTLQKWMAPLVGFGGGALGASMGHPYAGSLWATGLLAAQAISDPVMGANLARLMNGLGYGSAAKLTGAAGRAAALGAFNLGAGPQLQVTSQDPEIRNRLFGGAGENIDVPSEIRRQVAAINQGPGYKVDPELMLRLATQESGQKQYKDGKVIESTLKSGKPGARGVMQLMGATAAELGVDRDDPQQNIEGGIRYFKQLLDKYNGNTRRALAAYNAGPARIEQSRDESEWPDETQAYVKAILQGSK